MTGEEVTKRKVQDLPSVDCEAPLEMSAKRLKSEPIESDLDEDSKKLEQFAEIPSNGTATTSTDEMTVTIKSDSKPSDSTNNEAEFARKFRPKKLAILVSYSGVGYFGLQR